MRFNLRRTFIVAAAALMASTLAADFPREECDSGNLPAGERIGKNATSILETASAPMSSLSLSASLSDVHTKRGMAYIYLRKYSKAIADFEAAISINARTFTDTSELILLRGM